MRHFHGEHPLGNIFVRPNHLDHAGDLMAGHKHEFDHVSFVISGSATFKGVQPDGTTKTVEHKAGGYVLIRKGVEHEITATHPSKEQVIESLAGKTREEIAELYATEMSKPTLVLCVYSHRHPDGTVTEEYTGWEGAYV